MGLLDDRAMVSARLADLDRDAERLALGHRASHARRGRQPGRVRSSAAGPLRARLGWLVVEVGLRLALGRPPTPGAMTPPRYPLGPVS